MVGRAVVNHPYLFVHIDQLMRDVQRTRVGPGSVLGLGLGQGENTEQGMMLSSSSSSPPVQSTLNTPEIPSVPSRGEIVERYAAYCEKFEQYRFGVSGTGIGTNGGGGGTSGGTSGGGGGTSGGTSGGGGGGGSESTVYKPKSGQKQVT